MQLVMFLKVELLSLIRCLAPLLATYVVFVPAYRKFVSLAIVSQNPESGVLLDEGREGEDARRSSLALYLRE